MYELCALRRPSTYTRVHVPAVLYEWIKQRIPYDPFKHTFPQKCEKQERRWMDFCHTINLCVSTFKFCSLGFRNCCIGRLFKSPCPFLCPWNLSKKLCLSSLSPGLDSSRLKNDPCGCGGVVHGELGVHGGCAVSGFGGSLDWSCAPDPKLTLSSSGLGCCWLASGPCWRAPPHNPAIPPSNTKTCQSRKRDLSRKSGSEVE